MKSWTRRIAAGGLKGLAGVIAVTAAASLLLANAATEVPEHRTLESLDELRQRFQQDAGKVRAIFLAAPT